MWKYDFLKTVLELSSKKKHTHNSHTQSSLSQSDKLDFHTQKVKLVLSWPHPERRWLGRWQLGQSYISHDLRLGRELEEEFLRNSPEEP